MSVKSLGWAFENEEVFASSQKFVLVALANYASDLGKSYPAVATICKLTKLSDNTVRRCLEQLSDAGLIRDTGKRFGPTQQVKVWQLPEQAWKLPGGLSFPADEQIQRPPEDPHHGGLQKGKDPRKTPGRPPEDPRGGGQSFNLEPCNQVKAKSTKQTDAEWLKDLEASPAYAGIDVPLQRAKAELWIKSQNGKRQFTRRFFLNWLNRCERPISFQQSESEIPGWVNGKPVVHVVMVKPGNL